MTWHVVWRLVTGGSLLVVGLLTVRAGWLGWRGRLRPPPAIRDALAGGAAGTDAAFAAGAGVAGPPLLLAGLVALAGVPAAVLQPTMPAMFTVFAVVLAGVLGIGLATRRLVGRAAAAVLARQHPDCGTVCGDSANAGCAGCPLGGAGGVGEVGEVGDRSAVRG